MLAQRRITYFHGCILKNIYFYDGCLCWHSEQTCIFTRDTYAGILKERLFLRGLPMLASRRSIYFYEVCLCLYSEKHLFLRGLPMPT